MKLTPLDIRHREFRRAMRGYSDEEVDVFLDEVADAFESLFQENIESRERIDRLEEQIRQYELLKETLQKTLLSAQQQADHTKSNARKEAELILKDAEIRGRDLLGESYGEKRRLQQDLIQLKQVEEDFRFKFRSLLEAHLNLLAEDETSGDRQKFRSLVSGVEAALARQSSEAAASEEQPGPAASAAAASAPTPAVDVAASSAVVSPAAAADDRAATLPQSRPAADSAPATEGSQGATPVAPSPSDRSAPPAAAAQSADPSDSYLQFDDDTGDDLSVLDDSGEHGQEQHKDSSVRRFLFGRKDRSDEARRDSPHESEDREFQW